MTQLALAFVLRHVLTPNTIFTLIFRFHNQKSNAFWKSQTTKNERKKKKRWSIFQNWKRTETTISQVSEKAAISIFQLPFWQPTFFNLYITWYASKSIDSYQSSNYWPSIIRFPNRSLLSERKNFLHSCIILFVLANIIIEILDGWC